MGRLVYSGMRAGQIKREDEPLEPRAETAD